MRFPAGLLLLFAVWFSACAQAPDAPATDGARVDPAPAYRSSQASPIGSVGYVFGDTKYAYSTQAQPSSKAASFLDNTFHLPVKRITTTTADRKSYGTITEYPTFDPSSADGRYLILQDCGSRAAYQNMNCGGYVLYDAVSFKFLRSLSDTERFPLRSWDSNEPEPRWNRGATQNLHAFTYRKHMQLREYNVDTGADVVVHDFCSDFGPRGKLAQLKVCAGDRNLGYFVFMHEYGSPSDDTRYHALYVKNGDAPYDSRYAFVYDRTLDQIVGVKDISTAPAGMLGVHMSPSGEYVTINYFCDSGQKLISVEQCGVTTYTRDFKSWVKVSNYPDHMGYAWTRQGHEVLVLASSGTDHVEFTRLDTGQTYQIYPAAKMDYPAILYTYQKNPGWIFAATYGGSFEKSVWSNESNAGPGQIFAFEMDETKCDRWFDSYAGKPSAAYGATKPHQCTTSNQRIWRLAYSQNVYKGPSPYFMQVNPQVNVAGTRLWFGSNWRDPNNPPEVYQIDLPPTWPADLSRP